MNMSLPEVSCGPEGVGGRGYHPETPIRRDGPEKIPVVPKSISLQEVRLRPSLRDILECDVSGEGGNSSGVFTCSVDISDVCLADLTKLSDSTSSESISRSAHQLNREPVTPLLSSAVMSTPLGTHLNASDILTPMRSQSEFLSPQFGASDDYLRRNIKFIYKQLGSLMTQLRTEDKYFQTCSQRYEEVIANLEEEINALKCAKPGSIDSPAVDEPSETQPESRKYERNPGSGSPENAKETSKEHDAKIILQRIAQDLLPRFRSMIESASNQSGVESWECEVNTDSGNFKNTITVFEECLVQLEKIIKTFNGAYPSLLCEFPEISNHVENTKLADSGTESLSSFQEESYAKKHISNLENKISVLEALNDSLKSDRQVSHEEILRLKSESSKERETYNKLEGSESNGEIISPDPGKHSEQKLKIELEEMARTLAKTKVDLANVQAELECKSLAYESLLNGANAEKAEIKRQATAISAELSKSKSELAGAVDENNRLRELVSSKEMGIVNLEKKLRDLETEQKTVVDEFRIEGSSLILVNSKLKEELEKLHKAFDESHMSAERSSEKFNDLHKIYETLIAQMASKENEFAELDTQIATLNAHLKAKDAVLGRLCSNFNELLAIFRECQDLGLDRDSSATDIDDGFIRLKRRLLDLSQDYITLNNRNKVLERETVVITAKLKEKEHEMVNVKRKYESNCEKLKRTLEKLEGEKKVLVSQKIEQDDALKKMKSKVKDLELQEAKGCLDCGIMRNQLQQLQIDLVDKDATISTLELHIQSCCEYNRKKAQQYKHELHAYKRQVDAHSSFAVDFSLSPKKSKCLNPKVDVGIQSGESCLHHHTGGFVERFKIRELEEKVIKLEKERTVLKRLCKVRSDRIHELESHASLSTSHGSK